MADYQIRAVLSLVDKGFTTGFKKAIESAQEFSQQVKEHTSTAGTGLMVAGAAITAFGDNAVKSFGSFQAGLNKAAVVAGGSAKDIGGLSEVANKMAKDLPIDAQQASDAMVGMAQNGASVQQLKDYFPPIAKAATAASADLGKTGEAVQQAMNIWSGSATRNAAVLVQTANLSNASIETMGDAFSNVGTNAKSLDMDIDTTSEAIGLLTNRGMSSARASMDLNHALTEMVKPSNSAQKVMQQLGISYTDSHGRMKPFKEILEELNQSLAKYSPTAKQAALATMFGTAGEQAMLPLMDAVANKTGNASNSWDAYEKQLKKTAGTTKAANQTLNSQANEMQKNVGSAIEQVDGSFDDLKNTAMQSEDTVLRKSLNTVANLISSFQNGHDALSVIVRDAIGLSPILGPVITSVGAFAKAITSIGQFVTPWTLLAGAIAIVVAKLVQVYNSSKPLRDAVNAIGTAFKQVFGTEINNLLTGVKGFFESISGRSKGASKTLGGVGASLARSIRSINWKRMFIGLNNAINTIVSMIKQLPWKSMFKALMSTIRGVVKFIRQEWQIIKASGILQSVQMLIRAVGILASGLFKTLRQAMIPVSKILRIITAILAPMVSTIVALVSVLTGVIGVMLRVNAQLMKTFPLLRGVESLLILIPAGFRAFKAVQTAISALAKLVTAFKNIISVVKTVFTVIKSLITFLSANPWVAAIAAIGLIIYALYRFFRYTKTGRRMWSSFVKWFKNLWNGLSQWLRNIWNGIKTFTTTIWKAIRFVITGYVNAVKKFIQFYWGATIGWVIANFRRMFNLVRDIFKHGQYYMTHPVALARKIIGTYISGIRDLFKRLGLIDLWNAGSKVMNSFIRGLKEPWEQGKKFIGGLAGWIKEHKGPLSYDATLLIPAGSAIMQGLNEGLQNSYKGVQATIAGITNDIATSASTMPSAFNQQLDDLSVRSRVALQADLQNQQVQIDRRPANIHLDFGKRSYRTFVDDISNQQDKVYDLESRR